MRTVRVIILAIGLLAAGTIAFADTITSTTGGGPWSEKSTWVGGAVPGSDDDVVIAGPVEHTTVDLLIKLSEVC
jgi:hypothetical protein